LSSVQGQEEGKLEGNLVPEVETSVPISAARPFVLGNVVIESLEHDLNLTFNVLIGDNFQMTPCEGRVLLSASKFPSFDVPQNATLLFYVPLSQLTLCIEHYLVKKDKDKSLQAVFVAAQSYSGTATPYLRKMYPIQTLSRGTVDPYDTKLRGTLKFYWDKEKQGMLNALKTHTLTTTTVGRIGSSHVNIAFDTMASHSFINAPLLKVFPCHVESDAVLDVVLGNGKVVQTKGVVKIKVKMDSYVGTIKMHVLDLASDFDIILGNDWLSSVSAQIDYESKCVRVRNSQKIMLTDVSEIRLIAKEDDDSPLLSALQVKKLLKKKKTIGQLLLVNVFSPDGTKHASGYDKPGIRQLIEEFADIFEEIPPGLPPKRNITHSIPLIPGSKPVCKQMYRLSPSEKLEVEAKIKLALEKGWIEPSTSPWGAPILFVPKKGGGLRMCVDYRALNKATVKNKYPLPNIDDLLDCLQGAKYFSNLDFADGYHQIQIEEGDREKTAFRTHLGHFQYKVMPFGLCNAPATFQAAMDEMLAPFFMKHALVYLDDVVIYSKTWEEHLQHVRSVLQAVREKKFYCRIWKCHFGEPRLDYLGHVIQDGEISVDTSKLEVLRDWPVPTNPTEVRKFLGFTGYFRRFIKDYSILVSPLTDLTGKSPFVWSSACQQAFETVKDMLQNPPILKLADPDKPYEVVTDACNTGMGAVLIQEGQPVAYMSKKFNGAERNYSTSEKELLAVKRALEKWRCYLEGCFGLTVVTDHKPNTFMDSQVTRSPRLMRWFEFFQRFNIQWQYQPGKTNVADALSRLNLMSGVVGRMISEGLRNASLLPLESIASESSFETPSLAVLTSKDLITNASSDQQTLRNGLGKAIQNGYLTDEWFKNPNIKFSMDSRQGYWFLRSRPHVLVVPAVKEIRDKLIREAHDPPYSGHFGSKRTLETLTLSYWWPGMRDEVKSYIKNCLRCQMDKSQTGALMGKLLTLPEPKQPWSIIGIDFITDLPKTPEGYDTIFVICDHFSKMVHFAPTTKHCTALQCAKLLLEHVWKYHGVPDVIVSDRDVRFVTDMWRECMTKMGTKLAMSTAYHPQTGGQHERQNRVLEEVLRHYISPTQRDWNDWLSLAEFAMNNAYNFSTKTTPFLACQGWQPRTPLLQVVPDTFPVVKTFLTDVHSRMDEVKRLNQVAQERYKEPYDAHKKAKVFNVGELVLLSTKNLSLKSPGVKKLTPRFVGPYRISRVVNMNAYELELPVSMGRVHNVFHISLLKPFNSQRQEEPSLRQLPWTGPEDQKEYLVEAILAHRTKHLGRKVWNEFLVKWTGFGPDHNQWVPESRLGEAGETLKRYWTMVEGDQT
jgi:hypothetical protein